MGSLQCHQMHNMAFFGWSPAFSTVWHGLLGNDELLFRTILLKEIHFSSPVTMRFRNDNSLCRIRKETHAVTLVSKCFSVNIYVPKHRTNLLFSFSPNCNISLTFRIPKASASFQVLGLVFFDWKPRIAFSSDRLKFPSQNLVNHFQYVRSERKPSQLEVKRTSWLSFSYHIVVTDPLLISCDDTV